MRNAIPNLTLPGHLSTPAATGCIRSSLQRPWIPGFLPFRDARPRNPVRIVFVRLCLATLVALGLSMFTAAPLARGAPPGDRPSTMPARVWAELFRGTTSGGKQLSAAELRPLVTAAVWPPTFPTRVGWHLQVGVFLLNVRPDGTVSNVEILQSTGQGFIDRGVISAFAKWRFRPNSVKEVRIPAYYTIQR
jgi:TonB family protein